MLKSQITIRVARLKKDNAADVASLREKVSNPDARGLLAAPHRAIEVNLHPPQTKPKLTATDLMLAMQMSILLRISVAATAGVNIAPFKAKTVELARHAADVAQIQPTDRVPSER
jgi:hypothetical protein